MTGWRERSSDSLKTSVTLLEAVRDDATTRQTIASADVILMSTGSNEIGPVFERIKAGTCGGPDGADCILAMGETWRANYEAILDEIDILRANRPTVIRFVNDENAFVSHPEFTEGLPAGFATGMGAMIFQLLYDTMCAGATAHNGVCIDVRPIINGPNMDEPGDENSSDTMQAITDALVATGMTELNSP